MIVRQAKPEELRDLAALAERSYREGFRDILGDAALATRGAAFFEKRFEEVLERIAVAEEQGLAGFYVMTEGHVDMLFVDPQRAGRGVGRALLRHAEGDGARTLECFRENGRARLFYERNGWRLLKEYEREFLGAERAFVFYGRPDR